MNPGSQFSQLKNSRPAFPRDVAFTSWVFTLSACLVMLTACGSHSGPEPAGPVPEIRDFNESYEPVIDSIVQLLTLDEKIALLHGNSKFSSPGVERLGIPELDYTDGPFGIREEGMRHSWASAGRTDDSATYLPTGTALAATWNPVLARDYGITLGSEARKREKDVLLAPAINIIRAPLNGRNFEYLTEDPLLNAKMSVAVIQGVQSQDVAACVKHFAANNQETLRSRIDVIMDERTLREIYLKAFKASITEGRAFSIMGAYNRLLGDYCCENSFLLNEILKKEWGFRGAVISDWSATKSTVKAAESGLDIEMGTDGPYDQWYFADPLKEAVLAGKVDRSLIDEKAHRVLRLLFNSGAMDPDRIQGSINTPEHTATAYRVASEAVVLLKNEGGILPLDPGILKNIAVIGDNAVRRHAHGGFGAGVKARYEITPLEGLKRALPSDVHIRFVQGYDKTSRMVNDGRLRIETLRDQDPALTDEAVQAAGEADLVLFIGGLNHDFDTEGIDRKDYGLPYGQEELIKKIARVNPNTVLVIIAGSPVDLSGIEPAVPAILWGWLNGCEAGHAIADVILGNVNPSGKLPFTIPRRLEDSPPHALGNFPGDGIKVEYTEGLLVGYRWYDTRDIEPLFCFGDGLSYSDFSLEALGTDPKEYTGDGPIEVRLRIRNKGPMAGKQTVQLYVGGPGAGVNSYPVKGIETAGEHAIDALTTPGTGAGSGVPKPFKELRAFQKVMLEPGKEKEILMRIDPGDLAYFDKRSGSWVTERGTYTLYAGFSSRDIRQVTEFRIE